MDFEAIKETEGAEARRNTLAKKGHDERREGEAAERVSAPMDLAARSKQTAGAASL